jgi:hypothetical protein
MYREIKEEELKLDKQRGYLYFIDKNHPLKTGNASYVFLHRHVASIKEGRWLTTEEHVHHIDEDKLNNSPENLHICSASEHARLHREHLCIEKPCKQCGTTFKQKESSQIFCSIDCTNKYRVLLDGLTKEELEYLLWTTNYSELGKQFRCSDNGIRKWAKRLRCIMPPSYFHSKGYSIEKKLSIYLEAKEI